jgi:hypothetical protein
MEHPLHSDFEGFAKGLKKELKALNSGKTVLKSWACKPEYKSRFKDMGVVADECITILEDMEQRTLKFIHDRNRLWSDIEEDVQYFGNMRYNDDTNEIQAVE